MIDLGQRILNVRPDPIDPRDRDFAAKRKPRIELPESVFYPSSTVGPVVDQGETGSCVGQACAALMCWLLEEEFSARFIWMTAKEIDPWIPSVAFETSGTRIRDAFKAMNKYGACLDWYWPMDELLPQQAEIEDLLLEDAMSHRIGEYWKLRGVNAQRQHLATVGPFVAGVPVYENWSDIGSDGVVPWPDGAELGGHAILVTGYDERGFTLKNSWGEEWGRSGYGLLPSGYPTMDCWGTGPGVR